MKLDKHKPIIEMGAAEREACFDEVSLDIHGRMLNEARNAGGLELKLAIVYLKPAGETAEYVLSFAAEYGDGDGTECERDFLDSVTRSGLLLPGETLRLEVATMKPVPR